MNTEERLDEHGKRLWDVEQRQTADFGDLKGKIMLLLDKFDSLKESIDTSNSARKEYCERTTGELYKAIDKVKSKIEKHIEAHTKDYKKYLFFVFTVAVGIAVGFITKG